jgi:phospho-N-acetylmuramoyl-pentapeptide-transferase
MLYYLFDFLDKHFNFPGAHVFQYITFRAFAAIITSLLIGAIYGRKIIDLLRRLQIGETVRDLGLDGQKQKQGTPTMGGFIILAALVVPVLLFAKLSNVYIILLLVATVWTAMIGFLDDYIKVFKKNKEGLPGRLKIVGQVGLGLIVGLTMHFNSTIKLRIYDRPIINSAVGSVNSYIDIKKLVTNVPFFKNNQFDYSKILPDWILSDQYAWILYVIIIIFIITAVSNGANITDGIDGLAAGTSVIIGLTLAILAYVSGNKVISQYLNIFFIPGSSELVIFCAAFVGACIIHILPKYLWEIRVV